jgi:hypothetical protein
MVYVATVKVTDSICQIANVFFTASKVKQFISGDSDERNLTGTPGALRDISTPGR